MIIIAENGLKIGTVLYTIDRKKIVVRKLLGEGGQGYVYLVDYDSSPKALKWYKKWSNEIVAKKFYDNLVNNKEMSSPGKEFLWPIDIVDWQNDTFGYVMDLVKEGYYTITEYILGNVQFKNYKIICDAVLNMICAFRKLHNIGYSYQDLNDGNFFINPNNGSLLIGDNDNVSPNNTDMGILGKPRYMAPEIVIGKGKVKPDTMSDLYSLALLIFMLFTNTHPLEGKKIKSCGNIDVLTDELYGSKSVFILDPKDKSNAPLANVHKNVICIWPYFPSYLKEFFIKAFSHKALVENVNYRPREIEWLECIARFRNDIIICKNCGNSVFLSDKTICDVCGKNLEIKYYLETENYDIPAFEDTRIYNLHVGRTNATEALKPVSRIVINKKNPKLMGMANLSNIIWNAVTPSGKNKKVLPKDIVPLKEGISMQIDNYKIKIKK